MKDQLGKLWRLLSLPKKLQLLIMRVTQNEFLIGVTGVILNENKQVLICKHTYRQTKWSLPGGYIKSREHPKEGLAREIEEETGFIVRIGNQLRIRTDRETARLDISFVGYYVGVEFRPSHEVSEAGFFSFENLPLISKNQLLLIKEVLVNKVNPKTVIEKDNVFARIKSLFTRKT